MARKRPDPGASERSDGDSGEGQPDRAPGQDRFGPLAIERHVKDDGRALILYTHSEREPP
jgi:hypothetical protein